MIAKRKLSGSTDGKPILVTGTDTDNTVIIHTAVAGQVAGTFDEIWLWAYNGHTSDVVLTLEWGGAAVPNENICMTIPSKQGPIPIVPGFLLQNGLTVEAFAAMSNVITLMGFVNTITD